MNVFSPFKAVRYNASMVRISDVVAPPYDVISPDQRELLYEKDSHNVIRLELNHDSTPYESAAHFFSKWKSDNILLRDVEASYYVYYQTFIAHSGEQVTRRGVIGLLDVSEYAKGDVLPHEQTLPKAKKDRFELLDATHTQFSPIFGLIDDETQIFDHTIDSVTASTPIVDIDETLSNDEHIRHTMWRLTDIPQIIRLKNLIASKKVVIADGHHRYETSVAYRGSHPDIEGTDKIMIYLSNLKGEGTVILPTFRILFGLDNFNQSDFINQLKERYEVVTVDSKEEAIKFFKRSPEALTLIQFPEFPNWLLVNTVRQDIAQTNLERLSVYKLHEEILKPMTGLTQSQIDAKSNLLYPHTLKEMDDMISRQEYNAAFILHAITPNEMLAVTSEGSFMPQKSTYFYPKLLSGLTFYEFGT